MRVTRVRDRARGRRSGRAPRPNTAARRRVRHRGRLRPASGRARSGLHVDYVVGDFDSADPAAVERARAGARSSNAIRPRRTRPISSSRSTPRATGAQIASPSSAVRAAASTTSSPTCCCSRRPGSPTSRSTPGSATRTWPSSRAGGRRTRSRATPGRSSRCCRRAATRTGITTTGLQYPLHDATLRAGHVARREQRARRRRRRRSSSSTGRLLVVQPFGGAELRRVHEAHRGSRSWRSRARARGGVQQQLASRRRSRARRRPSRRAKITTVRLLTHSSFAVVEGGARRLHAADGLQGQARAARRRGRDGRTRRSSARTIPSPTRCSASTTRSSRARSTPGSSSRTPRPGSTRSRPALQLDRAAPRDADRRRATSASIYDKSWFGHDGHPPAPTSLDDLDRPALQEPHGGRERGDVVARTRVPARDHRAPRATNGWQDYWRALKSNGVRVDDDWTAGVRHRLHRGRRNGRPADRRVVRLDPAADVVGLEPAPRHAATSASSRRRASARPSTRACCAARTTSAGRAGARRLHADAAVPGGHAAADVREPGRDGRGAARRCSRSGRSIPPHPYSIDPATISAQPQRLDQGVDRPRRAMTRAARARHVGVAASRGSRCRSGSSRCSSCGRSRRSSAARCGSGALARRRSPTRAAPRRVVHAVASGRVDGADAGRRAARRVRRRRASSSPAGALFRAFVTVPFVLPTVVVATAFLALLRPGGPLVVPALAARRRADAGRARVLQPRGRGAHRRRLLGEPRPAPRGGGAHARRVAARARSVSVTLPLLAPSIIAAASIVFLFTFTSFGVALLLVRSRARDARGRDLPPGRRAVRPAARRPRSRSCRSSRCSAVVFALARAQERRGGRAAAGRRRPTPPAGRVAASGSSSAASSARRSLFLGGPLAVLVWRSLHVGGQWSLGSYRALGFERVDDARCSSRRGPRCATRSSSRRSPRVIALVVGGLASVAIAARPGRATRSLDAFLMLPLGTSAVTVGFGFLIAFEHAPFDFATSPLLVPIAHAVVAIPFVVRAVVPALRSIDPAAARRGDDARRVAAPGVARGRPADRGARVRGRGRASAPPCRSASSARRCSSPGPTGRRCRSRSSGSSPGPGEINVGQALAMSVILMAADRASSCSRSNGSACATSGSCRCCASTARSCGSATARALDGVDLALGAGGDRRGARPERFGQDHAAAGGRRPAAARRRPHLAGTAPTSPASPPHERRFGLMFQEYALFPHRDVAGNVEFGLRMTVDRPGRADAAGRRGARPRRARRVPDARGSRRSRAASSSGSRSPARSRSRPGCSCSTNRSARSTGSGGAACSTRSGRSSTGPGCRRCTSRTTTRRRSRSRRRVAIMRDGRVVQAGRARRGVAGAGRRVDRDVPRLRAVVAAEVRDGRGRTRRGADRGADRRAGRARSTSSCAPTARASIPAGPIDGDDRAVDVHRDARRARGRVRSRARAHRRRRADRHAPRSATACGSSIDPDALLVYPRRAD